MRGDKEMERRIEKLIRDVYATPNCMVCASPVGTGRSGGIGGMGYQRIDGIHVLLRYCNRCTASLAGENSRRLPPAVLRRVRWLLLQGGAEPLREVFNERACR